MSEITAKYTVTSHKCINFYFKVQSNTIVGSNKLRKKTVEL